MRALRAALAGFATLLCLVALPATAQVFSVDGYAERRAAMEAADERLHGEIPGSAGHIAKTIELTTEVHALVAYLNGWIASGEMDDALAAEALGHRFFLFENLVQLHADIGDCLGARSASEALRTLDSNLPPAEAEALRASAAGVAAACQQRAVWPDPSADDLDYLPPPPSVRRGLFAAAGLELVAGTLVALLRPAERDDRNRVAATALLSGGTVTLGAAGLMTWVGRRTAPASAPPGNGTGP